MLRVEQLRQLMMIVEFGSFSRAADQLHMSQPALSQSVRSLERQFGFELLDRHGSSGVTWSQSGLLLISYIASVIDAENALLFETGELRKAKSGLLRIGVVNAAAATILPSTVSWFHQNHPGIRLQITEASSRAVQEGVAHNVYDYGCLVGKNHPQDDDLIGTRLLSTDLVACVSVDHPWAQRDSVEIFELQRMPLIVHHPGYYMREVLDAFINPDVQRIVYTTNNTASLLMLVEHGLGITVLPRFSATAVWKDRLAFVPVKVESELLEVHLFGLRRNSRYLPRSVELLEQTLLEVGRRFTL